MFLGLPDLHPDPLGRGTDARIRIRTKMSHNHSTEKWHRCFIAYYDFSGEFRVHPSLATDPERMVQSARWLRITDAQIGRRTYLG
jgi:hypothetical protein